MQISETLSQDLHKQFTVTVLASELEGRVNARLEEMKPRVNLKGFRPGKAPVSFLKKQFGKSIMGEVVEAAVNEGSQKAIADNKLKPALQPRVEPVGSVEDVVDGKADLTFKVIVDLMRDVGHGLVGMMIDDGFFPGVERMRDPSLFLAAAAALA